MKLKVINGGRSEPAAPVGGTRPELTVLGSDEDAEPHRETAADAAERLASIEPLIADGTLIRQVAKAAAYQVFLLRRKGIPVTPSTAEDLAHEALIRTIDGRRPWDGSYPLGAHLHMVIESIAGDMRRHQKTHRHGALKSEMNMDESSDKHVIAMTNEVAAKGPQLAPRPRRAAYLRDAAAHIIEVIRIEMRGDDDVQRVANAWEEDPENTIRAYGIKASGLSPADYDAAVKRIKYMIKNLPSELRDGAADAMEESYGA